MKKINVGVIGCGNISGIYFENLKNIFLNVNVYACADISSEASQKSIKRNC